MVAIKKYINTTDLVKLTGRPDEEIRELAKNGVLPAHKSRKGHWRFNVDAVEKYFGIVINNPKELDDKPPMAPKRDKGTNRVITNGDHYQEVILKICKATSSIKIMTANFKRFRLMPTYNQGEDYKNGTPFVKYLMAKAVQGVSVQIICSRPSSYFTEEWEEYYRQMNPELFEYKFCERNHSKVVIIDDKIAYVGSANVTPAGLGQGIFTPGNFEVGILTEDPDVISNLNALFSKIWDGKACANCHRAKKCNE